MREIKFRAWDKKQKCWILDQQIKKNFNQYYNQPNSILMQYTGLKDKRRKEIYEGDVLYYKLLEQNYLVQWDIHNAKFSAIGKRNTFDSNAYRASAFDQMEIVGNIYENPELLEKP